MEGLNRRIVILGKSGSGKSSLSNTLLGAKGLFKVDHTLSSGTGVCQAATRSVNGRSLTVIDTPGFFSTNTSKKELKPQILRCITECAPGPHAFLIVLKVEKFTEHEESIVNEIRQSFSDEVFKYSTVVFTHGDNLEEEQKIRHLVRSNRGVIDLVDKCGGRCHVIDNKYWKGNPEDEYRNNKFQVSELLKTVDKMIEDNNRSYYTNEMLQLVEREIQEEQESIRTLAGNMSEEEIREVAKKTVFQQLMTALANVTSGVLYGAFIGVKALVSTVVTILQTSFMSVRGQAAGIAVAVAMGSIDREEGVRLLQEAVAAAVTEAALAAAAGGEAGGAAGGAAGGEAGGAAGGEAGGAGREQQEP